MAIIKETIELYGITYDRTYSDLGMMIERDGYRYKEAIDILGTTNIYTETNEPIPKNESSSS